VAVRNIHAVIIAFFCLTGCVVGIKDAYTPPKVKPCQKVIIVYPDNTATCMTNEEFDKWVKRNLPTQP